jgi:hypothetical protein
MQDKSAGEQIDDIIQLYGGWKGQLLTDLRALIKQADPEVTETVKWKMRTRPEGLPVWEHNGILCLAETFKNDVKLVFVKGVRIQDPTGLFNARLMSKTDRAIEFHEGYQLAGPEIIKLVRQAVELNQK